MFRSSPLRERRHRLVRERLRAVDIPFSRQRFSCAPQLDAGTSLAPNSIRRFPFPGTNSPPLQTRRGFGRRADRSGNRFYSVRRPQRLLPFFARIPPQVGRNAASRISGGSFRDRTQQYSSRLRTRRGFLRRWRRSAGRGGSRSRRRRPAAGFARPLRTQLARSLVEAREQVRVVGQSGAQFSPVLEEDGASQGMRSSAVHNKHMSPKNANVGSWRTEPTYGIVQGCRVTSAASPSDSAEETADRLPMVPLESARVYRPSLVTDSRGSGNGRGHSERNCSPPAASC